jgi:hypothetical protein
MEIWNRRQVGISDAGDCLGVYYVGHDGGDFEKWSATVRQGNRKSFVLAPSFEQALSEIRKHARWCTA